MAGATTPGTRPPPRRTPAARPGQRQPDSPEDTVSDKTRITMKGQPAGTTSGSGKPGSSVRRAAAAADAPPASKPPSGKGRGLPVARPIEESGKSKKPIMAKPIAPLDPLPPLDPLASVDPLGPVDPLGAIQQRGQRTPQWVWWAAAGGAVLAVIVVVVALLMQLN